MRTPKSKFIKNKIKNLKWNKKNSEYIENLIELEHYILDEPSSMSSSMRYGLLKGKFKKEYLEIYKELKPKELEKINRQKQLELKKEERERHDLELEEKNELAKDKKLWKKFGGKF